MHADNCAYGIKRFHGMYWGYIIGDNFVTPFSLNVLVYIGGVLLPPNFLGLNTYMKLTVALESQFFGSCSINLRLLFPFMHIRIILLAIP